MARVRDGDLDQLSLLFARYKRPLMGFFYGLTRDTEASEDLLQNTFFRVLRYRHLFRGDGEFRSWLFHIARNVNHDRYRKEGKLKKESIDLWANRLTHEDHSSNQWIRQEEHERLAAALAKLDEDKREVLLLSKYQEKRYREIGLVLGCTEAAVKVKVFRAMNELRQIYMDMEKKQ